MSLGNVIYPCNTTGIIVVTTGAQNSVALQGQGNAVLLQNYQTNTGMLAFVSNTTAITLTAPGTTNTAALGSGIYVPPLQNVLVAAPSFASTVTPPTVYVFALPATGNTGSLLATQVYGTAR